MIVVVLLQLDLELENLWQRRNSVLFLLAPLPQLVVFATEYELELFVNYREY